MLQAKNRSKNSKLHRCINISYFEEDQRKQRALEWDRKEKLQMEQFYQ